MRPPVLAVEPEAGELRRRVGLVAWCALEALTAHEAADAASLADVLGVGRDRARAAVAVLVEAGLVTVDVQRAGRSGRWAGSKLHTTETAARLVHPVTSKPWGAPAPELPVAVHPRPIAPIAAAIPAPAAIPAGIVEQLDLFAPDPHRAPADAPDRQAH